MEFIKKKKFTIIAIAIFLVVVLLALQVKNVLFPNVGNAVYGDRLKEIEKVSSTEKKDIITHLESDERVTKAEVVVNGTIFNVIVTVQSEVELDASKELADKTLEKVDSSKQKQYDIQIFIQKTEESNNFPIIGYKHSNRDGFSWTKDRA